LHCVNESITRIEPELVARFAAIKMEVVARLPGVRLLDSAIKPLVAAPGWRIAGPALTVALEAPDGLMGAAAVAVARPGDVILVAAEGDCSLAAWGGGLTRSAKVKGVAGVIVDGAAMDSASILDTGVPFFCRTTTLHYQPSGVPGSVNVDIVCGGAAVAPGDLVMADADGVLIVPRDEAAALIAQAEARHAELLVNKSIIEQGAGLFELRGGRQRYIDMGVEWREAQAGSASATVIGS
jgi:regulator of RNase E activity RraA